ncbi:TPA: host cell division inhibitor Icd-like protein [Escherichia coli]|nr:host cell division inhibitor Icd-like protein [Escherichia coli]HCL9464173.1 host cell division inhibitor Icd-like protein [Escherichia coli]
MAHKTKATAKGSPVGTRENKSITNNATFAAGGQCDQCAGLLVGYSCSLILPCRDVFQVCDPIFVRLYSLRNFSRTNAHGANLSCSCSLTAFLRCFFLDEDNFFNDLSVIVYTCNPVRHSSPHHGAGDGYSCSLALRRWRRLISPRMAALINCPVLSPSSFTFSMPSIISWAIRAVTDCDFAFFGPVAMSNSLCCWCKTIYTKKNYFEGLTCKTLVFYIVSYTLLMQGTETTKPRTVGAVTGLLTKPLTGVTIMAGTQHTQTHPKFIYTFTALHRDRMADGVTTVHVAADTLVDARRMVKEMGYVAAFWKGREENTLFIQKCENNFIWRFIALSTAQPRVITIVATSEQEARQQSPAGCVMVFAARIRQGVCHA